MSMDSTDQNFFHSFFKKIFLKINSKKTEIMFGPIRLNFRSLLLIKGKGSKQFLQGLVTKDLESLDRAKLIYTFLLNVKGRILADMLIWRKMDSEETYLLETDSTQLESLQRALKLYRLRKTIEIKPIPETKVYFCSDPNSTNNWHPDPRVPGFGYRTIHEYKKEEKIDDEQIRQAYLRHRFDWGIAEGSEMNQQIPLNMNGDLMNGISFEKGCYIGQELVARIFHLGVVRRRLMPFRWIDPKAAPTKLCPIELARDQKESRLNDLFLRDEIGRRQGKLISSYGECGLCLASVQAIPPNATIKLFDGKGRGLEVRRPKWWPKIDQQGNPTTTEN